MGTLGDCSQHLDELTKEENELNNKINQLMVSQNMVKDNNDL